MRRDSYSSGKMGPPYGKYPGYRKPPGMDATCPHNCMCLCCQDARKVEPFCSDCGEDECVCPEYRTIDGETVTLDQLCRLEPAWAANRIRELLGIKKGETDA